LFLDFVCLYILISSSNLQLTLNRQYDLLFSLFFVGFLTFGNSFFGVQSPEVVRQVGGKCAPGCVGYEQEASHAVDVAEGESTGVDGQG
jgi:hypothetical protein